MTLPWGRIAREDIAPHRDDVGVAMKIKAGMIIGLLPFVV